MDYFIFCTDSVGCYELLSKLMEFKYESEHVSTKGSNAKILFVPSSGISMSMGGAGREYTRFMSRSTEYILNYRMNLPQEIADIMTADNLANYEIVNAFEANELGQHRFQLFSEWFSLGKHCKNIHRVWFEDLTESSLRKSLNNVEPNSQYQQIAEGKLCEEAIKHFFTRHAAQIGCGKESLLPAEMFVLSSVYRRELEVELSQRSNYYLIQTKLDKFTVTYYQGNGETKIIGIESLEKTLQSLVGKSLLILKANKRFRNVSVPLLYNTADLLESPELDDPEDTLTALDILFTRGYISNPETTSRHLWNGSEEEAGGILGKLQENPDYSVYIDFMFKSNGGPKLNDELFNSEFVDNATGIIPTGKLIKNDHLIREEVLAVYDTIVRRFLKQFMGPQVLFKVEIQGKISETEGFFCDQEEVFQHGHDIADMDAEKVIEVIKNGVAPSRLDGALEYSVGLRIPLQDMVVQEKSSKGVSRFKKQSLMKLMSMPGKRGIRGKTSKILRRNYGVGEAGERPRIIENLAKRALIREDVVSHEITLTEQGREALMQCLVPLTEAKTISFIYTQLQGIKAGVVEPQDFMSRCLNYFEDMMRNSPRLKDCSNVDFGAILKRLGCPNCEGRLGETADSIKCGGCAYQVHKAYRKHQLTEIEMVNIIKYGDSGFIEIDTPLSKTGSMRFKLQYDKPANIVREYCDPFEEVAPTTRTNLNYYEDIE